MGRFFNTKKHKIEIKGNGKKSSLFIDNTSLSNITNYITDQIDTDTKGLITNKSNRNI